MSDHQAFAFWVAAYGRFDCILELATSLKYLEVAPKKGYVKERQCWWIKAPEKNQGEIIYYSETSSVLN